jgi:Carboxypeptidase regulatory-like domain/TonB dependent receptor-like, beta-barrel
MADSARAWAVALSLLCLTTPLVAQTTGRIQGTVTDNSGAAVPGVAVSVSSSSLQGVHSTITDSKGEFRFASVPPGSYSVRLELAGFKTVTQSGVVVGIDRTVSLPFKLEVAALSETVSVTGESPVIDTNSSSTGVNATADLFNRLPVQRDVYSVARVAPGTQDDGVGTVFYGSSGAENNYIIEGLNTTGIELGRTGKTLNFDFVEEIEVKTGGLPAEYGRMTGGVLNVLTKSGGNNFKGDVFGFYEGGSLQSDDSTATQRPATTTSVTDIDTKFDFGADLGGYLIKDKLWFFGAYNRTSQTDNLSIVRTISSTPGTPGVGSVIPRDTTRNLFAAKLTWSLSANHRITASAFGDPGTIEGPIFTIAGPEVTWKGTNDVGATDWVARYDGNLSSSLLVRAMYGLHKEKSTIGGPGRETPLLLDQTVVPNTRANGFGGFTDQDFQRSVLRLDITKFAGGHEFKLGGDIESTDTNVQRYSGGAGQIIYKLPGNAGSGGVEYYRHRYFLDDQVPGFSRTDSSTWKISIPLTVEPQSKSYAAYLQDSWKLAPSFTLNLGVRWELQNVLDRFQESVIKLDQNWAPRVGFVWDVTKNGKSKLYASWGRFYENIPQDINIRAFGGEIACFCYNFSPNPADILGNDAARRSTLLGGSTEPVDPDLKGQYIDEAQAGFEYEVAPNLALGAKFTYRTLGRVIEDFLVPSEGSYFIANPSEGTLGKELAFYDGVTHAPAPAASRKNYSFEINARKRFSNNWQFLASYVYTKLEGNYDGLFQNSSGQLDPNINSAFDYADFTVNAQGRLSAERQHQFKFDGSYEFKGALDGLNVGLSTWYYSGLPQNAYGYSLAYANWEYFLAPRGTVGRGPADYETNLHLSYPIKVGAKARLNLIADFFNLFDRQAITQYDERYNLVNDGECAGVPDGLCNGDGGLIARPNTVDAAGQISNIKGNATNPDYLKKGIGFTGARSIRLGVRFTF